MGILSNKITKQELKPGDHIYSWRRAYIYAHHGIYIGDGKVIHFTRGAGQEIGTGTFLDTIFSSSSPQSSDTPCPICGNQASANGVILSCIDCFLSGGELHIFIYNVSPLIFLAQARGGTCTLAKSDPSEDVLHRAEYLLKNGFGFYNLFKNNCEDFAIYCKTGLLLLTSVNVGCGGQTASFLAATTAVASSPLRFLASSPLRFLASSPLRFLTTSFGGLTAVGLGSYCVSRLVSDIGVRRDVIKIPVCLLSRSITDEAEGTTLAAMSNQD